jgi:hypothetical protein
MGEDKTHNVNARTYNEPICKKKDCCGTTRSLGEVEGIAEEGSVEILQSEQEREQEFFSRSSFL